MMKKMKGKNENEIVTEGGGSMEVFLLGVDILVIDVFFFLRTCQNQGNNFQRFSESHFVRQDCALYRLGI